MLIDHRHLISTIAVNQIGHADGVFGDDALDLTQRFHVPGDDADRHLPAGLLDSVPISWTFYAGSSFAVLRSVRCGRIP